MAKKSKKPAKKRSPKKSAGRASTEPKKVSTGRGASPMEIGADLVSLFNAGRAQDVEVKWHAPNIESVEGVGMSMAWRGRKAVQAKNEWWMSDHEIHGASAEGPYGGATGFAVKFRMDVETKSTGKRETMEEVAVYTVKNGKIVREEFMYFSPSR